MTVKEEALRAEVKYRADWLRQTMLYEATAPSPPDAAKRRIGRALATLAIAMAHVIEDAEAEHIVRLALHHHFPRDKSLYEDQMSGNVPHDGPTDQHLDTIERSAEALAAHEEWRSHWGDR